VSKQGKPVKFQARTRNIPEVSSLSLKASHPPQSVRILGSFSGGNRWAFKNDYSA